MAGAEADVDEPQSSTKMMICCEKESNTGVSDCARRRERDWCERGGARWSPLTGIELDMAAGRSTPASEFCWHGGAIREGIGGIERG